MTIQTGDICRINCPNSWYHGGIVEVLENPTIADKGVFVNGGFLKTVKCLVLFSPSPFVAETFIIRLDHLEKLPS